MNSMNGRQAGNLNLHPVGGRNDQNDADDDCRDCHDDGIGERRLEAGIAQHDPVGIERIGAATHAQ